MAALEESKGREAATANKLHQCEWQLQHQVAALREEAMSLRQKAILMTRELQDNADSHEEVNIPVTGTFTKTCAPIHFTCICVCKCSLCVTLYVLPVCILRESIVASYCFALSACVPKP